MAPSAPSPAFPLTYKRAHSIITDLSPSKKPNRIPKPSTYPAPSHIFIVTTEQTGPYLDTETKTIGAYASSQDAMWKAQALQIVSNEEDFETSQEGERTIFAAEDGEGDRYEIWIDRLELRAPGSEEKPASLGEAEVSEDVEDEKEEANNAEEEEASELEDQYAYIKATQQRGGVVERCKGVGCRKPLCSSCWPQREGAWQEFRPQ